MNTDDFVTDLYEDDYPDDDDPGCKSWKCVKCNKEFIDPEEFPNGWMHTSETVKLETQLYWLGISEPVCSNCAVDSGLPPIDKE